MVNSSKSVVIPVFITCCNRSRVLDIWMPNSKLDLNDCMGDGIEILILSALDVYASHSLHAFLAILADIQIPDSI